MARLTIKVNGRTYENSMGRVVDYIHGIPGVNTLTSNIHSNPLMDGSMENKYTMEIFFRTRRAAFEVAGEVMELCETMRLSEASVSVSRG